MRKISKAKIKEKIKLGIQKHSKNPSDYVMGFVDGLESVLRGDYDES